VLAQQHVEDLQMMQVRIITITVWTTSHINQFDSLTPLAGVR